MTAPWRVGDADPTPVLATNDGYCFAPFYPLGAHHTYRCSWPLGEDHPGWHVAADQLGRVVAVWPVAALPEGRVIAPRDRHPTDPTAARRPGESAPKPAHPASTSDRLRGHPDARHHPPPR